MVRPARSFLVAAALVASIVHLGPTSPAMADPTMADDPEYSPSDAPIGEKTDTDQSGLDQSQPRFRMADPSANDTSFAPKRAGDPRNTAEGQATKEDFLWANLTAKFSSTGKSPASGDDPEIGNKAKHSFYDFRDGFDLPKYVAGPKSAK